MNTYRIISAVSLVAGVVILLALEWQVERHKVIEAREVQRLEMANKAQDLKTHISARISLDVNILYGLRAFIESNPNVTPEDYAKYAESVTRTHPAIRNIAAAPNLIVEYVFPYEENKSVIGLDYRKGPEDQKSGVYKAIRAGKPVVAGPVTLIQGGEALIIRLPVFVDTLTDTKDLWGILSAPVDLAVIYKDLKIDEFAGEYELAIRGQDGLGHDGAVFYGEESMFHGHSESVLYEIDLGNGSWIMAVKPIAGWTTTSPDQKLTRIIFLAILVVLIVLWLLVVGYIKGRLAVRNQNMQTLREKTEFLEILSHEIRSPLQGVLASQKYLLDNGIEEPMRSVVKTAQQSGDYIISLINDYLDLQRAESNSLNVYDSVVNIRAVFGNVQNIVAVGKNEQTVALNFSVRDSVPQLLMLDEKKITQVLVNIIGNAVKFTETGYIRVTATYTEISITPELQFVIEDTGIGIKNVELITLFDRFTRSAGGEGHSGSGLGLAIAKTLVDVLSGSISVTSIVGEGTTFTIRVPTKEALGDETSSNGVAKGVAIDGSDQDILKDAKVLVADDVVVNRILLNAMLSPMVASVTLAEDGHQVLDALAKSTFDLIIMDLQMPNMSGLEATKLIRSNPVTRNIPIIGLTGDETSQSQNSLAATGLNALLSKPINLEPLVKEMVTVLEVSRLQAEAS